MTQKEINKEIIKTIDEMITERKDLVDLKTLDDYKIGVKMRTQKKLHVHGDIKIVEYDGSDCYLLLTELDRYLVIDKDSFDNAKKVRRERR